MKTNFLKSIVLFSALSLVFTACQKDSLVTEMETTKTEIIDLNDNYKDKKINIDNHELPINPNDRPNPAHPIRIIDVN